MNLLRLSWKNLRFKPLNTTLCVVLFALGVGLISLLFLLEKQLQDNFEKNKRTKVGKPTEHKYLLHGLLYCEDCGYKFFGKRRKASRENTYRCSGNEAPLHICNNSKGFNIGRVETFILKHLFETKELQNHLNSIEVDDDTLELLELELKQLHKKITSTEKMVTRSFNMIYESGDKELLRWASLSSFSVTLSSGMVFITTASFLTCAGLTSAVTTGLA